MRLLSSCPPVLVSSCPLCVSGRADRPRSAADQQGRWSHREAEALGEGSGSGEGLEAAGTPPVLVSSCPPVLLSSCPPALSASQVGLTVRGRPGSAFGNEVRHIIAARDEARPHAWAADKRDAGPYLRERGSRAVGGWRLAVGTMRLRAGLTVLESSCPRVLLSSCPLALLPSLRLR